MTYLHKLARRLSVIRDRLGRVLPVPALVLAACSPAEEREFLSPNPGNPSSNQIVALAVQPRVGTIRPGEAIRFTATATTAAGKSVPADIEWVASGGLMDQDGTFRADANGKYNVRAQLRSQPMVADSARVAVFTTLRDVVVIQLEPDSAILVVGEGLQITARAELADGSTLDNPPLVWTTDGGYVDGSGWFTPPGTGAYTVTALASGGAKNESRVGVKPKSRVMTGLDVTPETATVDAGSTTQFTARASYSDGTAEAVNVNWSATGGTITSQGLFTAGSTAGNYRIIGRFKNGSFTDTAYVSVREPQIVSLSVAPGTAALEPTASQQYVATALMSNGTTKTVGASWKTTSGSITADGLYTAPSQEGTYKVVGSVTGTSFADTADVAVQTNGAVLTQLVLNPSSAAVPAGTSRQFAVTASYSDGSTSTPSVSWQATGGTITAGGLYTAGVVQGIHRVIATEPGSGKADTSDVTVTSPILTQLVLEPSSFALEPGKSRQMTVSGTSSDGSTTSPAVSWSATGGSITSAGAYTAGGVEGTYRIIASSSGLADTSFVTIESAPVTLSSLSVSPATTSVQTGGGKQFSASGTWSDGSTGSVPVTWSATGGSIGADGFYVAGQTAGTFRVVAVHAGGLADTAEVTVTAPVTLVALDVSPSAVSLQAGQAQQFSVTGTYSNGGTGTPSVTWSATGGTITSSGLYTAGQVSGSFLVIASCVGCSLADTASVSVGGGTTAPTLQSVEVSPSSVSLLAGESREFQAVGRMSDGSTTSITVSWSATGGTMAGNVYTAGQTAGTYQVTATEFSTGKSGSSAITIDGSQTPTSREPEGVTRISERGFNALIEDGWGMNPSDYYSIQQDALAIKSASATGQVLYPAGFEGGKSPLNSWRGLGSKYRTVYVSFWFMMSPNWVGHSSRVNKLFHLWIGGGNKVVLSATGMDSEPLRAQFRVQGLHIGGSYNMDPNLTSATIQRGKWHHWEAVLVSNSLGLANGSIEWWLDGVKVGSYTSVGFVSGDANNLWETLSFAPTWGGVNDVVPADQWIRLDHIVISGK